MMIEGLDALLADSGEFGLAELRGALADVLGGQAAVGCVLKVTSPAPSVFRVHFATNSTVLSLIVKRLRPSVAWRNQLVVTRWLPAIGLGDNGPILLATAAERSGHCVWHVYEDFGDGILDATYPNADCVEAAVTLLAQLHTRFERHPLLGECRMYGGDRGLHFYSSSLRDAISALESLQPPAIELNSERLSLRNRLLERLYELRDQRPWRAQALAELGGPETLLHGDPWTVNILVVPAAGENRVRLIDWDRAAVGPVSYDLSTFLMRFPTQHRFWIFEMYQKAVATAGWQLPSAKDLNVLFETAEYARCINCLIWPAIAILRDGAAWGFDTLAEIESWFEGCGSVLPDEAAATA